VELTYMDVWPAQTVRSEMIEATGRRPAVTPHRWRLRTAEG